MLLPGIFNYITIVTHQMKQSDTHLNRPMDYVINPHSVLFNSIIEKRVQFVQGANSFVTLMLLYESIRYIYYYFAYRVTCSDYSYLVMAYLAGNLFWIATSLYGFKSIDTRVDRSISHYHNLLICVLITRIFVDTVMTYFMDQQQDVFKVHLHTESAQLNEQVRQIICMNVYQKGLMLIQGILETIFLITMIALSKQIKEYVRGCQSNVNIRVASI